MPEQLIERHGIDYESVRPIVEAFGSGDVGRTLELTSSEVGEKLSIAGTPEEWVEKIESDVLPSGFNHLIAAIADPYLVKSWSGLSIEGLPYTRAQSCSSSRSGSSRCCNEAPAGSMRTFTFKLSPVR